jgi:RNA polymerase sigma-70 factor (ECF subfamily)
MPDAGARARGGSAPVSADERPDGSLFEQVALPFLPDCHAFALSLARHRHDAEDLVQETFLKAQRAFHSFTPGTNAKAWLFTILRRLHIDRYRRQRIRPVAVAGDEIEERAARPALPRDEDLPWDALPSDAVGEGIEALPERFRLAVRLRDLDGLSYREIAEVLDVPEGTVMSRLHRGREYLRRHLVAQLERPGRTFGERA